MKIKFTLLIFIYFIVSSTYAQFNENAPWLQDSYAKRPNSKISFNELDSRFETYFKAHDRDKKGSGFKPYMRWRNHWRNYIDQTGNIAAPSAYWQAWEEKNKLAQKQNDNSNWTSIGPYTTVQKTGQGRVNTFIVDPNNPNTFYVGAPSGGLWKSTDSGVNWTPLTDNLPQIGVSGIAIDPNNSNIIYIATGDDDARDTYSVGVMKSIDGGITWNPTGLQFNNTFSISHEIYIHPNNSDILWVATSTGVFKTTDAGANWERKLNGNIRDLKLKPGNPDVIYAATSTQFFKSTDGGETFTNITSNLPDPSTSSRIAIDITPANPEVVYVLSADKSNKFNGVYKSTDSGDTFNKTIETDDIFGGSTQAWYDMALTVSPTDENIVFVGVLDIWRSTDGGDNFEQINQWWNPAQPSYTHADIHFMRYFNGKLYAGTDGGIYVTSNNGDVFTDLSENLSISQYYKVATAKNSKDYIAGGLQDNGGFAYSSQTWNRYHGGDGMDCAIDPNNRETYYGFTQFGGSLNVTYTAGVTQGGTITNAPADETNGSSDRGGNWVTPLMMNKDGDLFAGYKKVYKLENSQWKAVTSTSFFSDIDELEISNVDNNLMYISLNNVLHKSTNGGVNFTRIMHTFDEDISSIEINNNNNDIVYVTLRGYGNSTVFKSEDGGQTWTDITLNLPNEPKMVIKHQNQSPDNDLYIGTTLGVYHINDTMTEWEVFSNNLPNVPVADLEINISDKTLTAGTYGRGVWQTPITVTKADFDVSLNEFKNNQTNTCSDFVPVIEVLNNGNNAISVVDISYSIDGSPYQYQYNGNIQPEQTVEISLPVISGLSFGEHSIEITAATNNDAFIENNNVNGTFTVNNSSTGQYVNTFGDVNQDVWLVQTIGTETDLWQQGNPTSNTAFTNLTPNGYITNPDGRYTDKTTSYLISPCYDLTTLQNPLLKFNMAFKIEKDWDVAYMEYSTDFGKTWTILGTAADPNWYNSNYINAERPITVGAQWTGEATAMKEYSYDLSALNSEENVIFRFVFASDEAVNEEGVFIDDFVIDATAVLAVNNYDNIRFNLFPNPADNGSFTIQREGIDEMQVTVYDITGRKVYQKDRITDSSYRMKLNVDTGIYFIQIREGDKQTAKRIIIR